MLDLVLFGVLPYVAATLFLVVSIQRYRKDPFSFSSLSSQFLESKRLFWGSVPFHIGIIVLFFGHLIGFLFPRHVTLWNGEPLRLFILESTGLIAAILTAIGLVGLIYRRIASTRLRQNASWPDIAVYGVLFFQILTGLWIALGMRWGSAWYTHTLVPYLWSVLKFSPDLSLVAAMPHAIKAHVVGAWVLFGLFSFTRLVHVLVAPVPYLWRPVQLVIWYRRDRKAEARG